MASDNATTEHYLAPAGYTNSTDNGGALLIVNLIGLILVLASVGLRIFIARRVSTSEIAIYKDDLFCFAAAVICVFIFALTWTGVSEGNGKAMRLISPDRLIRLQKILYAIDIFYIPSLYFSRASAVLLLKRVQSSGFNKVWASVFAVISAWAVASIFLVSLKCNLHQPWIQYNIQCTGLFARWDAIEISGIVIECLIFACAIYIVHNVRMGITAKVKVLVLFGTRALVVLFAIFRLMHLGPDTHSPNQTYRGVPATLFGLAEVYASVITATTPLIKSFLVEFKILGQKPTIVFRRTYGNGTVQGNAGSVPNPGSAEATSDLEKNTTQSTPTTILGGSTRSAREPWTLRHDCTYTQTNVMSMSDDDDESETTLRGGDGIQVVKSYKVAVNGN